VVWIYLYCAAKGDNYLQNGEQEFPEWNQQVRGKARDAALDMLAMAGMEEICHGREVSGESVV
jgi:hypothetical protein